MARNRQQRRLDDLKAASAFVAHLIPVQKTVEEALLDVGPGQDVLPSCVQDARLVCDIAKRLDELLPVPDPVETWDGFLWVLVASLGLAVYRRSARSADPEAKAMKLAQRILSNAMSRAA